MLPPVLSPVSAAALARAIPATLGFDVDDRDAVQAALCAKYRMEGALLTDSGTSALVVALRAVTKPGDTVAYPAYACIDLTTAALAAGLKVRLYDLDPATLSPDLDSVRAAVHRGVQAIVVAHLFGYPADVKGVVAIADGNGIPVIEDAAQGAGGALNGQRLGALSNLSILSFGRGKGTTAGSGGAVLSRSPQLVARLKRARNDLGAAQRGGKEILKLAAQMAFSPPELYRLPASIPALRLGEMVFHPPSEPRAMTATAVSLLQSALRLDADEVEARKTRARLFLARGGSYRTITPVRPISGGEPGYLRLAMLQSKGDAPIPTDLGSARGYPMTLAEHRELSSSLLPGERAGRGAQYLRDRLFTLPTHSGVRARDISNLFDWLGSRELAPAAGLTPVRAW